MTTILHITDTHLSRRNGLFLDNVVAMTRIAEAVRPDLTVLSGDLSLDGAGREDDMAFAAETLRALPGPVLALPGNHDVGSHPMTMPLQPYDDERRARFVRHFGPGRGVVDLPGWCIVGLDTEVMATGNPEEEAQAEFVRDVAAGAGDRRIALFLHKPVFVTRRNDPEFDMWSIPPEARPALSPLLDHPGLRLVASGHLHRAHRFEEGRATYAWAPAASFVMEEEMQVGLAGERVCGVTVYRLGADRAGIEVLTRGMTTYQAQDVQHLTYPVATT